MRATKVLQECRANERNSTGRSFGQGPSSPRLSQVKNGKSAQRGSFSRGHLGVIRGQGLSTPKSQRFLRLRCPSRTPEIARFPRQDTAMLHCDLRVRWKVAGDLRYRAAISEPKTPSFCGISGDSFCGISGDLAQSTRKSLAIAIVRFWCAKVRAVKILVCSWMFVESLAPPCPCPFLIQ